MTFNGCLSEGRAARTRGTGSRQVPHRLNTEEVKVFKLAKEKGFLTVKGSGYRRERKGSPLANIYRQWCDAMARPCIVVEQQPVPAGFSAESGGVLDTVLVDLSPLRNPRLASEFVGLLGVQVEAACQALAGQLGCRPATPSTLRSPFTVLAPSSTLAEDEVLEKGQSDGAHSPAASNTALESSAGGPVGLEPSSSPGGAAMPAAGQQAPLASEAQNSPAAVVLDANEESSVEQQPGLQGAEQADVVDVPIWKQAPRLVGFQVDRATAKALAKALSSQAAGLTQGRS
ncbi:hypothetical protein N2152v2_001006 [Parachlorella kessleri]